MAFQFFSLLGSTEGVLAGDSQHDGTCNDGDPWTDLHQFLDSRFDSFEVRYVKDLGKIVARMRASMESDRPLSIETRDTYWERISETTVLFLCYSTQDLFSLGVLVRALSFVQGAISSRPLELQKEVDHTEVVLLYILAHMIFIWGRCSSEEVRKVADRFIKENKDQVLVRVLSRKDSTERSRSMALVSFILTFLLDSCGESKSTITLDNLGIGCQGSDASDSPLEAFIFFFESSSLASLLYLLHPQDKLLAVPIILYPLTLLQRLLMKRKEVQMRCLTPSILKILFALSFLKEEEWEEEEGWEERAERRDQLRSLSVEVLTNLVTNDAALPFLERNGALVGPPAFRLALQSLEKKHLLKLLSPAVEMWRRVASLAEGQNVAHEEKKKAALLVCAHFENFINGKNVVMVETFRALAAFAGYLTPSCPALLNCLVDFTCTDILDSRFVEDSMWLREEVFAVYEPLLSSLLFPSSMFSALLSPERTRESSEASLWFFLLSLRQAPYSFARTSVERMEEWRGRRGTAQVTRVGILLVYLHWVKRSAGGEEEKQLLVPSDFVNHLEVDVSEEEGLADVERVLLAAVFTMLFLSESLRIPEQLSPLALFFREKEATFISDLSVCAQINVDILAMVGIGEDDQNLFEQLAENLRRRLLEDSGEGGERGEGEGDVEIAGFIPLDDSQLILESEKQKVKSLQLLCNSQHNEIMRLEKVLAEVKENHAEKKECEEEKVGRKKHSEDAFREVIVDQQNKIEVLEAENLKLEMRRMEEEKTHRQEVRRLEGRIKGLIHYVQSVEEGGTEEPWRVTKELIEQIFVLVPEAKARLSSLLSAPTNEECLS